MKKSKKIIGLIAEAFEFNKNENELLVTTDNVIFLKSAENLAKDHAIRNGAKVETVKRDEEIEELEIVVEVESTQTVNFTEMTIDEIKEFATEKGIELIEESKENLITELELALTETEED